MSSRRLMGVIMVVLATAPVLVSGASASPVSTAGDTLAAVQAVGATREAAVRAGDEAAFMATVDPDAPEAFRAAQRNSFRGLRSVPVDLQAYRVSVTFADTGDLAPPGLSGRYDGAQVVIPETEVRLRIQGYDVVDDIDTQWLTYVQRGEVWYVGGDSDLKPLGLETERQMWDLGEVVTLASDHFLVITRPGLEARAQEISRLAEEARATLDRLWSVPWPGRLPIILPESADELEEILQTTFDLDNFVAFVAYQSDVDADWQATAPRMYIQDENLGRHPTAFQTETLVHELVHAAMAPGVGPFVDAWVHEGVADWVAKGRGNTPRPAGSDGHLPENHEFTTGGGDAIRISYNESRSAVSFLARQFGTDAPDRFWQELGAVRVAPGDAEYHESRVLGEVGAGDIDQFEREWGG